MRTQLRFTKADTAKITAFPGLYKLSVYLVLPTLVLITACLASFPAQAWVYSGGDTGGTRYSPLDQVNRSNVENLDLAWMARSGEHHLLPDEIYQSSSMQSTPILLPRAAGEYLVVCSANNYLIALDPASGIERWQFDPQVSHERQSMSRKCRGNAFYWLDETSQDGEACHHRLFMGTLDRRLVALDAMTGEPCADFGQQGEVDLTRANDEQYGKEMVFSTSQPVVVDGKVIIGSAIVDLAWRHTPVGNIIAFDALTGEDSWRFDIVPTDSYDPAAKSWPSDAAQNSGSANAWAPLSVDVENKLVFVPTSSPSPDFYGGHRHGDNRYSNSLVALDTSSGKPTWHFQFVHHDLWDYDTPAQPILYDHVENGVKVPAVLQLTKQGMLFAFNRLNGEPLIPIEERPVPGSYVPGEKTSPTQPFSHFQPLVRHSVTAEDVWGLTPIDRRACMKVFENTRNEGIYTPPGYDQPSLIVPSDSGGANWGGGALTPQNILITNVIDVPQTLQLVHERDTPQSNGDGAQGHGYLSMGQVKIRDTQFSFIKKPWLSPLGVPCIAPPWNKLVAVNLGTGDILWESPLGSLHDQGPFPLPFDINGFGMPGLGSGVSTGGGLFVIAATADRMIRAFDSANGHVLWSYRMPVDAHSGVSTYFYNGRQYFVTTAGGHDFLGRESGDYILAFALPAAAPEE